MKGIIIKLVIYSTIILFVFGCSPYQTPITPVLNQSTQSTPSLKVNNSHYWREFREPLDEWGIAIPEEWINESQYSQEDGGFLYMFIRNYDDNYFRAHTAKGGWIDNAYLSTVRIEIYKIKGLTGSMSLEEAVIKATGIDGIHKKIASSQEIIINNIPALEFVDENIESKYLSRGYAFRINEDEILLIRASPTEAWNKVEIISIINSIVLERGQNIVLPSIKPSDVLTGE